MHVPIELASQTVDLWLLDLDHPRIRAAQSALVALLLPWERERYARIVVEHGRLEQCVTRVLVRQVLSRYAPVDPSEWRFAEGNYGRPRICGPELPGDLEQLDFNISHTRGLVVCLVTRGDVAGMDVEERSRARRTLDIAERFFAPSEADALRRLPVKHQPQRFIELWTLKEAYIKARGMGLQIPLEDFSFDLEEPPPITFSAAPRLGDDPAAWQFALEQLSERHQLAIAIRRGSAPPFSIVRRDALPLLLDALTA